MPPDNKPDAVPAYKPTKTFIEVLNRKEELRAWCRVRTLTTAEIDEMIDLAIIAHNMEKNGNAKPGASAALREKLLTLFRNAYDDELTIEETADATLSLLEGK